MHFILPFSGKSKLNLYLLSAKLQNTFLSRHDASVTPLLMVVPSHQKPFPFQVPLQVSSGPDLERQLPKSKRTKLIINIILATNVEHFGIPNVLLVPCRF